MAPNIKYYEKRLSDKELKELQNKCMCHVCPSAVEGYGHYIGEAVSCGAVVLTTNRPPMNEIVPIDGGMFVEPYKSTFQKLDKFWLVDWAEISNEMKVSYSKDFVFLKDEIRNHYLENKAIFTAKIQEEINNLK